MKKVVSAVISASILSASVVGIVPASARPASQMTDLVGARGGQAESQVEARGFTHITSHAGSLNNVHAYWWHNADKNCIQIETANGRYVAITDATKSDCHKSEGGAGAAVGAAVGVAILGALLSSKSHHREGQTYDQCPPSAPMAQI